MRKKLCILILASVFLLISATTHQAITISYQGINIIYPKEGDIVNGVITIQWYVFPEDVDIYIYLDMNKIEGPISNTGEYEWDTTSVNDGYHEIIITAQKGTTFIDSDSSGPFLVNNVDEPPLRPTRPDGPLKVKAGISYIYSASTTDPDLDEIYYQWKWGIYSGDIIDIEQISDPIGPYESGEIVETDRIWDVSLNQTITIQVKAIDEDGMESDWSEPLVATVPKNIISIKSMFEKIFGEHMHILPLLRHLLVKEKI